MEPWRHAAAALVTDLRRVFGDRLRSLAAYGPSIEHAGGGPLTCLALVSDTLTITDLEGCATFARGWERHGLATPLILPEAEFRRSLDAFPLEYGEIIRAHERIFGEDPFTGAAITREDLRRAVETQAKSHLVHLREGFIEAGGDPKAVAGLVTASAPAFAALLRHVAHLCGGSASGHAEATREGARSAGLPDAVVTSILALEQRSGIPTTDAARLFPAYLSAVEQLTRFVDAWRP
ncbi:MAG: hypothetical protein FJW14_10390 [Acidimicrobiia bacterium]|nr:hypothetical protein [Acidimicrobiia bacterium]